MNNKYNNTIEISVRAIIRYQGKILICRLIKKGYYFFPGGHVEFNETLTQALKREMKEELGLSVKSAGLIGIIENRYSEDKIKHHEINFIYDVIFSRPKALSLEKHIDFEFLSWNKFNKIKVYPIKLQKELKTWWRARRFFSVSGGENS